MKSHRMVTNDGEENCRSGQVEYRRYQPRANAKPPDHADSVRATYGPIRGHFRCHPGRYGRYQRWLAKAGWGTTYDAYLTRVVVASVLGALGGILLGFLAIGVSVAFTDVSITAVEMVSIVLGLGFAFGGSTGIGGVIYPHVIGRRRAGVIDNLLPHAVVLMRAESHIDRNPITLIRDVANASDVYGELSMEFQTIQKDVELLNDNLIQAMANTEATSPSSELRDFFDDFSSLLESGGDIHDFLDREVNQQLAKTEERFDAMIRRLTTLAPVYIIIVSIGPLILIVTLIVLSIVGVNVIRPLVGLIYVGLPLLIVISAVTLNELTRTYRIPDDGPLQPLQRDPTVDPQSPPDQWFEAYQRRSRYHRLVVPLRASYTELRDRPQYSLVFSAPLAVLIVVGGILTGHLTVSVGAFLARPIGNTIGIVIAPFLVMSIPLMVVYEFNRRRARAFEHRFPNALSSLAGANSRGVPFDDGVELVAKRYSGIVAEEFRITYRDIRFDDDIVRALTNLANRYHRLPRVKMTIAVLRNIIQSSEDISDSLASLANEFEARLALERRRMQEMKMYSVIVVLGVLIYLLIVVILDVLLLPQLPDPVDQAFVTGAETLGQTTYHLLFFHSSLLLATGSGFIIGKLTEDTFFSGLKYVNTLVVIVLVTFILLGAL